MTNWSAIHNNVRITTADRFHFIKMYYQHWPFEEIEKFIYRLNPDVKIKITEDNMYLLVRNVLRMTLCKTLSSTFCFAETTEDFKHLFYIGVRSKKDIFKLKLKYPDLIETKTWSNQTLFYVRVVEGDSFSTNGELFRTKLDYDVDGVL